MIMKDIKISKKHIFLSVISVLMVLIMICFAEIGRAHV